MKSVLTALKNPLLLQAAFGQKTIRPPVWLMRQAGRYMKEYQAIKAKHSFMEMVKTPDIAAEVTLLPIELLEVDAAIMFSDILVTAQAMGGDLAFLSGIGPVFSNPVRNAHDVGNLIIPDAHKAFHYVYEMIRIVQQKLDHSVPLIGFAGAPFTVMSYLVEGKSSPHLKKTKALLNSDPQTAHLLLEKIATVTADYLNGQIEAGVNAIQIFDSWADVLSWEDYQTFAHAYVAKMIEKLNRRNVPVISFCRGSSVFWPVMIEAKPDVISLDWNAPLRKIKKQLPANISVQGNLDPFLLYGPKQKIEEHTLSLLESMRAESGFIFNLGHGILPDIPFENVKSLVDLVKEWRNG